MTDEFEGYRAGDITYCVDPKTQEFFPVRVVKIGRRFLDVESLDDELAEEVAPEFGTDPSIGALYVHDFQTTLDLADATNAR